MQVAADHSAFSPPEGSDPDDDEAPAAEMPLVGAVTFVGRVADGQTGNLPVQVLIENTDDRFAVGQIACASITVNEKANVLAVPVAGLIDVGDGDVINVVRDGKSLRAQPELGIRDKKWVEISGTDLKEPLKVGELVVVEGGYNLPDATPVTVKSGDSPESNGNEAEAASNSQQKDESKSNSGSPENRP